MKIPGKMVEETLDNAMKKPATLLYPFEKEEMPDKFRGRLNFIPEKCVGCKLCEKDCPANAIKINKLGDKLFEAVIDLHRCIFCAQCVDSCVRKALETTKEFELAQLSKENLRIVFKPAAPPSNDTSKAT
jgi:formate hydrogenlyase subunit 6/NADH:ubiquinone oxidoreductase subunit I